MDSQQRLLTMQTRQIDPNKGEGIITQINAGFRADNIGVVNNTPVDLYVTARDLDYIPTESMLVGAYQTRSFPIEESTNFRVFWRGTAPENQTSFSIFMSNQPVELYGGKFDPNDAEKAVVIKGGNVGLLPGENHIGAVDLVGELPAGTNPLGTVALDKPIPAGTNLIGKMEVAAALPAGSNTIGKVGVDNKGYINYLFDYTKGGAQQIESQTCTIHTISVLVPAKADATNWSIRIQSTLGANPVTHSIIDGRIAGTYTFDTVLPGGIAVVVGAATAESPVFSISYKRGDAL